MLAAVFCGNAIQNKMELELKHLSAYLPYELQVKTTVWQRNISEHITSIEMLCTYLIDNKDDYIEFLPILKPLSDVNLILTELKIKMPNTPNFDWLISSSNSIKDLSQTIIEYCVFDFLCQNHFDVFNLIEQGLAININTLSANGS